ncbi:MAG: hypothetical protein H6677_07100 [Candidatus Obscuribacterales bacterium]|nr:hypothetical protein [Cyanobacteria bacterium HKST-UBA01]MCB9468031.1 hypothetical protein [Candidatus Obscuribacterales bacterium]
MSQRNVDFEMDRLIYAWRDDSPDNLYYLDLETGEIQLVNRTLEDVKDLTDEIELERNRYLYLPKPERDQVKNDLRDFMSTIEDQSLLRILEMAFESPHVYSSFLKILDKDESEKERLQEFIDSRSRMRVLQWLEANCINTDSMKTTED